MDQLMTKAVDVVVEAEWLVKIRVTITNDETEEPSLKTIDFFQSSDATLNDVRQFVQRTEDIPSKEQRLYSGSVPIVDGPIPSPDPEGVVELRLRRVCLDPRLEALFGMVGMGEVGERHELMQRMMKPRPPGGCFCGNADGMAALQDGEDGEESNADRANEEPDRSNKLECAKCLFEEKTGRQEWVATRGNQVRQCLHVCDECKYALCTSCKSNDSGWAPPKDPYSALEEIAIDLGRKLASFGCGLGGRGHFCGRPVSVENGFIPRGHRLDGPRRRHYKFGIVVHGTKQVLHRGITLRIRLQDDVRAILDENGIAYSEVESDTVLPDGATVPEMKLHCSALRSHSRIWELVAKDFEDRHPFYRTWDGGAARAYDTVSLVSFGVQDAVIELGANIDDDDY